jgi:hypothetical protein
VCQNWTVIDHVFDREIRELYANESDNRLFLGGSFKYAGDRLTNGIAVWDGVSYDSLGGGESNCWNFCGPILCIAEYSGDLYVGGHIFEMGGVPSEGIAKWNGDSWEDVGGGLNGYAAGMAVIDGLLYVGGSFNAAGGIPANGIAVWDGGQWQAIGDFPNTWGGSSWMTVGSILKYQNHLFVAGLFPEGNGISHSIARWNGSEWHTVGESIQGVDVWINDMEVYEDELYVAGYFYQTYGNPSSGILKWDGVSWSGIGSGVEFGSQVSDLQVFDGHLYACGNFTTMSGMPAESIAKWDGQQWCGIGSFGGIRQMAVFQNELHISYRTEEDSVQITRVAKWTGGDHVDTCGAITNINEIGEGRQVVSIHPNPSTGSLNLSWGSTVAEPYSLLLYDAQGRVVQIHNGQASTGHNALQLNMSHLPAGIYFGRLVAGDGMKSFKWVRE